MLCCSTAVRSVSESTRTQTGSRQEQASSHAAAAARAHKDASRLFAVRRMSPSSGGLSVGLAASSVCSIGTTAFKIIFLCHTPATCDVNMQHAAPAAMVQKLRNASLLVPPPCSQAATDNRYSGLVTPTANMLLRLSALPDHDHKHTRMMLWDRSRSAYQYSDIDTRARTLRYFMGRDTYHSVLPSTEANEGDDAHRQHDRQNPLSVSQTFMQWVQSAKGNNGWHLQRLVQEKPCIRCCGEAFQELIRCADVLIHIHHARDQQQQLRLHWVRQPCPRNRRYQNSRHWLLF